MGIQDNLDTLSDFELNRVAFRAAEKYDWKNNKFSPGFILQVKEALEFQAMVLNMYADLDTQLYISKVEDGKYKCDMYIFDKNVDYGHANVCSNTIESAMARAITVASLRTFRKLQQIDNTRRN